MHIVHSVTILSLFTVELVAEELAIPSMELCLRTISLDIHLDQIVGLTILYIIILYAILIVREVV